MWHIHFQNDCRFVSCAQKQNRYRYWTMWKELRTGYALLRTGYALRFQNPKVGQKLSFDFFGGLKKRGCFETTAVVQPGVCIHLIAPDDMLADSYAFWPGQSLKILHYVGIYYNSTCTVSAHSAQCCNGASEPQLLNAQTHVRDAGDGAVVYVRSARTWQGTCSRRLRAHVLKK